MMPILFKGDEVKGETKVNARHSWLRPAQELRVKKKLKSKFGGNSGVFELALDRNPKYITKGLIS